MGIFKGAKFWVILVLVLALVGTLAWAITTGMKWRAAYLESLRIEEAGEIEEQTGAKPAEHVDEDALLDETEALLDELGTVSGELEELSDRFGAAVTTIAHLTSERDEALEENAKLRRQPEVSTNVEVDCGEGDVRLVPVTVPCPECACLYAPGDLSYFKSTILDAKTERGNLVVAGRSKLCRVDTTDRVQENEFDCEDGDVEIATGLYSTKTPEVRTLADRHVTQESRLSVGVTAGYGSESSWLVGVDFGFSESKWVPSLGVAWVSAGDSIDRMIDEFVSGDPSYCGGCTIVTNPIHIQADHEQGFVTARWEF